MVPDGFRNTSEHRMFAGRVLPLDLSRLVQLGTADIHRVRSFL